MRFFRVALFSATALLVLPFMEATVFAQTQEAVAQSRFNHGRELFIAGKYADALTEFRAATALVESPNTRLYIARCERELGHFARAYVEFQRAATEAADRAHADARYVTTSEAAKQESVTLIPKLAHVVLVGANLPSDIVIEVAGSQMNAAALGVSAPVDPGRVEISARAKGYISFQKTVEMASGEEMKIEIALEPDPNATVPSAAIVETPKMLAADDSPHRTGGGVRVAGYVVGGVGVVGIGLFVTFSVMAQVGFNQLQNDCGTHCDGSFSARIDDGKRNQLIANVSLGAGAATLLIGAIMIAAGGPKTVDHAGHVMAIIPSISPLADGRGASIGVWRAF